MKDTITLRATMVIAKHLVQFIIFSFIKNGLGVPDPHGIQKKQKKLTIQNTSPLPGIRGEGNGYYGLTTIVL